MLTRKEDQGPPWVLGMFCLDLDGSHLGNTYVTTHQAVHFIQVHLITFTLCLSRKKKEMLVHQKGSKGGGLKTFACGPQYKNRLSLTGKQTGACRRPRDVMPFFLTK